MADFATLIWQLKQEAHDPDLPVVGFGGSYGGMLATWFRIKYPHLMDGAISGSGAAFEGEEGLRGTRGAVFGALCVADAKFTCMPPECTPSSCKHPPPPHTCCAALLCVRRSACSPHLDLPGRASGLRPRQLCRPGHPRRLGRGRQRAGLRRQRAAVLAHAAHAGLVAARPHDAGGRRVRAGAGGRRAAGPHVGAGAWVGGWAW